MKAKQVILGGIFTYILGAILTSLSTFATGAFFNLVEYEVDLLLSIAIIIFASILIFFILRPFALKLLSVCKEIKAKRKLPIVLLGTAFFLLGAYTWIIVSTQFILS
jgi:hypothetical protein